MKVRTKLVIGFSIFVVLLWGISWFAGNNFANLNSQFAVVEDTVLPSILAMKDVGNDANQAYDETMAYIYSNDTQSREAALLYLSRLQEILEGHSKQVATDTDNLQTDLALTMKISRFNFFLEILINQKGNGVGLNELLERNRVTSMPALLELEQEIGDRIDLYVEELAVINTSFENTYESSLQGLIFSTALITLLAIVGATIITRSITRPLHALHKGTEMIAQGDFDYKVGTKAKDEIGQLSRAFDQMTNSLNTSMTSVDSLNKEITERKRAEAASRALEENFSKVFHSSPAMVSITTLKDGRFIEVNDSFTRITGYTLEEVTGSSTTELGLWTKADERTRMLQILEEQGRVDGEEFNFRMKSGEICTWLFSAEKIDVDNEPCLITMAIDITERQHMEQQLKLNMEELQAANLKLQELDKMKDSFLSTVSHELRTPLTSIKSFAEILLTYDEDKDTQREFLTIINDESDRLTKLINNFLDLSKIESGRMQWETVELSLTPVIKQAINITQAIAKEKNLTVEFSEPSDLPTVSCDKDRTVQVVTNLLSNSIKFTPENGTISLAVRVVGGSKSTKGKGMVVVNVTDDGIGIAPEDQEAVFEKFKQVGDTLTDKPMGTGLGLPICKEIIENYGGQIWVESELGKGSTFFFSLPVMQGAEVTPEELDILEEPEAMEETEIPGEEGEIVEVVKKKGGKKILVVDDEDNIRRFLSHELNKKGYIVYEAANGKEALALAREHHPDLITLDIQMPDLNGFDVTSILKHDNHTKDIPILILSVIEDKDKAYRLGVNDYMTKPFNCDDLLTKVNHLITNSSKNILVVDDDKSLVRSVKYHLERKGYSISVAHDGEQALKRVERRRPDLILLDIMMPKVDGYEVIKELKSNPDTASIRIILMTGIDIDGGRITALSIGATDYITKSDDFNRLYDTVDNILSNGISAKTE